MIDISDLITETHHTAFHGVGTSCGPVLEDSVPDFPRQIHTLSVFFEHLNNSDALLIMRKSLRTDLIQRPFSGMSKRRMAKIMSQSDRIRQVLIEPQGSRDGPGQL